LIAIEPSVHFHPVVKRRAKQRQIEFDLRGLRSIFRTPASISPFRLWYIAQSKIRRAFLPRSAAFCGPEGDLPASSALRPLMEVRFDGFATRRSRPWKWVFEGCDLCRDTAAALHAAGFASVSVQPMILPTIFVPMRSQITAVCVN
jgi:hypothetical protein